MQKKLFFTLFTLSLLAYWGCKGGDKNQVVSSSAPYAGPPYTVQLEEYVNPNLPDLHSYSHAIYGDKIVMIGGRTNGLHGGNYNFDRKHSNADIFVISTNNWATPETWTVKSLPYTSPLLAGAAAGNEMRQFQANNAQFFTEDSVLYIVGGLFGSGRPTQLAQANNPQSDVVLAPKTKADKNLSNNADADNKPFTLPYMTAVTLPALINTVNNGVPLQSGNIRQVKNDKLAVTGGELELMGNTVKLVFGWNFFIPKGDLYTHQIRSFTYTDDGKTLSISPITICPTCQDGEADTSDTGNFRRRDGSMSAMIDPANGASFLMYYAGVFKNGNINFDTPVWIGAESAKEENFTMYSNVYTCKVVPVYSPSRMQSYATLMGGMKNAVYTGTRGRLPILLNATNSTITSKADDFSSIPNSNQFSTVMIDKQHQLSQYLLPDSFPATKVPYPFADTTALPANSNPYNGAEAELLWTLAPASGRMPNGVVNYDEFIKTSPEGGAIGYLHGGILFRVANTFSSGQQNQLSRASNRIFAVKIVPVKQ
jgi:hypothetical protein